MKHDPLVLQLTVDPYFELAREIERVAHLEGIWSDELVMEACNIAFELTNGVIIQRL